VADVEGRLIAASRHLDEGQPQRAEQACREILKNDPNQPEAEFHLGKALEAQGRHEEALACHERTLWLRPTRRWRVIQAAVARLRAKSYLEIGVSTGETFRRVAAPRKIGIDPIAPTAAVQREVARPGAEFHRMTSDQFFATHAGTLQQQGIDVAFVDGLHTYAQSLVDVHHCLRYLTPGGVILVHDCNPPSAAAAVAASSLEEVAAIKPPGWRGAWTGDVWKTVVDLRYSCADVTVCVLDCDFGVGLIVKRPARGLLPYSPQEILRWTYDDLKARRKELLDLQPPERLFRLIGETA